MSKLFVLNNLSYDSLLADIWKTYERITNVHSTKFCKSGPWSDSTQERGRTAVTCATFHDRMTSMVAKITRRLSCRWVSRHDSLNAFNSCSSLQHRPTNAHSYFTQVQTALKRGFQPTQRTQRKERNEMTSLLDRPITAASDDGVCLPSLRGW